MTNTKTTKRALLASVLSVLMCISMLIGSTFAWFTDTASTNVNKIQAGNLNIKLVNKDGTSVEGQTIGFVNSDGDKMYDILWEPGCSYLLEEVRLVNEGNLWAKCKLAITAANGTNDGEVDLAKVIDVYEGDKLLGTLRSLIGDTVKDNIVLAPAGQDGCETKFGQLKLVMQKTAGNEYQGKALENIAITVLATQWTEESDSYGKNYDADAKYKEDDDTTPAVVPEGIGSLSELIEKIEVNGNVYLTADISDTSSDFNMGAGLTYSTKCDYNGDVVIGFNGKDMMFDAQKSAAFRVASGKTFTLNGSNESQITVLGQQSHFYTFSIDNEKAVEQGKATSADGRIIINGGYYVQAAYDTGYNQPMFVVGKASSEAGAKIIINGGKFWNKQGNLFDVNATGDVEIYCGQFVDFDPSQGMNGIYFLAGQTSSEIPAGYTVTSESITLSDGAHTLYTVTYSGN